jgi:hypothetical protein
MFTIVKQLICIALLGNVILYLNGLFAFSFFADEFDPRQGGNCDSFLFCFVTSLNMGFRFDSGLADIMSPVTYSAQVINSSLFLDKLQTQTGKDLSALYSIVPAELYIQNKTSWDNPDLKERLFYSSNGTFVNLTITLHEANVTNDDIDRATHYLSLTNQALYVEGSYVKRLFYDVTFYIVFHLIIMNIVLGE